MLKKLYVQILLAVVAGVVLGVTCPDLGIRLKVLSDMFVSLLQMILAPVIFCTVVLGISKMENLRELGRIGAKAFLYFELSSTLALALGLAIVDLVRPGAGMDIDPATLDGGALSPYAAMAEKKGGLIDFLVHMVPHNIVDSFARGDILQILVFSLLLGIALSQAGEQGQAVISFFESLLDSVFRIVRMIMRLAPLAALCAMAFTVGRYGLHSLASMGELILCVYAAAALFILLFFGGVARLSGIPFGRFLLYIRDEVAMVAGTCSSESVLPQLMLKMEAAGVPRSVVGLVIPGGLTFNAVGSAVYLAVGALFVAQATGTSLTLLEQVGLLAVLMMTSKGSAGVAGAGFVTLAATIAATGKIPLSGLVLLLGVDSFMAQARSVTNTIGNAIGALAVAAWEGCLDREKMRSAFAPQPRHEG